MSTPAAAPFPGDAPMPAPLPGAPSIPAPPLPGPAPPLIPPAPFVSPFKSQPPPIPIHEPQSFDIKDQTQVNAFLSQSFETNKINEDNADYIAHSEYYRYLYQYSARRHYRKSDRNAEENKTRKYALPFLKQYKLPNTLISKQELQVLSVSSLHPSPMTAPLPFKPDPTSIKKAVTCHMDKMIYFQFCDVTMDDVKQNGGDQEKYTIVKIFDFDDKKRNMMIVGSLSPDIGVILNKTVCEGLEKNVSDYMYPQRNRQIVIEIQSQKGRTTRSMYLEMDNLKNKDKLIDKSLETENKLQEKLEELMVIKDHDEIFSEYKVRIHDLVDPSLLKVNYNLNDDEKKDVDGIYDTENELRNNWIPGIFHKNEDGNIEIVSEINNLSRLKYPKLYKIAGSVFKKMLPSFEWITGYDFDTDNINDFKVIVKMMNYEIMAGYGDKYKSMLHREGHEDENIIAVGIYYYYISDSIVMDRLKIEYEWKLNNKSNYNKRRKQVIEQEINVKQNNFIVFNNGMGYQHQLNALWSGNKEYIVKRKILAFFLVDPKASKFKLEQDIVVLNLEDKIDIITMNWSRQCVMNKMLSVDVIKLIFMFTMNDDKQYYLKRDMKKMNGFIQDAENEYKNRPKPRLLN